MPDGVDANETTLAMLVQLGKVIEEHRSRGEGAPAETAAQTFRLLNTVGNVGTAHEVRAILHVERERGNAFATEVLQLLDDDEWWSTPPAIISVLWGAPDDE